jgi:predicted phage terminase large subunit-like protein
MTHRKARELTELLGPEATRRYLKAYFANKRLPTEPAIRRMEFGLFFFPDALSDDPPGFHLKLFEDLASPINSADAAPRGHAKTTVGSNIEVCYRICNNLNHYILPISDTYSQARENVNNVRGELESNEMLRWVYGDLTTTWHWQSGSFTTANEVRVTARGSNMKVRGLKYKQWRPDFVIVDDLENDEAVMKQERREKLYNWFFRAVLPAMSPDGKAAIVGTVMHEDSLLNNALLGEKGFGGWRRNRFAALIQNEAGQEVSLWPSRFPVEVLRRMRDDPTYERYLGPMAFAQEMQNEAIDEGSRVIKRAWIYGPEDKPYPYSLTAKEAKWAAEHPPDSRSWVESEMRLIVMAVDPAISEKTTADFFGLFVIGIDKQGDIWELDAFKDRIGEIDRQIDISIDYALKWKVDKLKVESVAYQAGLARGIRRRAAERGTHLPVQEVVPDKDKYRRAVIHSANFAGGLVHLRTDHPLFDAVVKEFLDFPMGEHDDVLDAYMNAAEDSVQKQPTRIFKTKPKGF